MEISNCWINLTYKCNLRCAWCYARGTKYESDQMSVDQACELLDLLKKADIHFVTFIGGDPTCYDMLHKVIGYASHLNIQTTLVTNGVLLNNEDYLNKIIFAGLKHIDISLKGYSQSDYLKNTECDCYDNVLGAVRNLSQKEVSFSVSLVLSRYNINNYIEIIKNAQKAGAHEFNLSFFLDFSILENETSHFSYELDIFNLIETFIHNYPELDSITDGRFSLHQTFPLCLWDEEFINQLNSKGQIASSCQLLQKSGLIFNPKAQIIPCNAIYQMVIGQYGVDFINEEQLTEFWNSQNVNDIYKQLTSLPSVECARCSKWSYCGGGCLSNWLNYDYDSLMKAYKTHNSDKSAGSH